MTVALPRWRRNATMLLPARPIGRDRRQRAGASFRVVEDRKSDRHLVQILQDAGRCGTVARLKLSSGLIDLNISGRAGPAEQEAGTGPGSIPTTSCLCQPPDLGGYGYEPTRETSDTYRHRHSRRHLYPLCDPGPGCLIRRARHLAPVVPKTNRRRRCGGEPKPLYEPRRATSQRCCNGPPPLSP